MRILWSVCCSEFLLLFGYTTNVHLGALSCQLAFLAGAPIVLHMPPSCPSHFSISLRPFGSFQTRPGFAAGLPQVRFPSPVFFKGAFARCSGCLRSPPRVPSLATAGAFALVSGLVAHWWLVLRVPSLAALQLASASACSNGPFVARLGTLSLALQQPGWAPPSLVRLG